MKESNDIAFSDKNIANGFKERSKIEYNLEMSKTMAIQQFKVHLNELRDRIFQNQCEMDNDAVTLQKEYLKQIQLVDSQF